MGIAERKRQAADEADSKLLEGVKGLSLSEYSGDNIVELDDDFISAVAIEGDSFTQAIIAITARHNFDRAKKELAYYEKEKAKIPGFTERTQHYFNHSRNLIDAIAAHKNIPNFELLRTAKKKALREQVILYLKNLQETLIRIERVDNDLKVQDVRSTVWVVRTFGFCFITIIFAISLKDAVNILKYPLDVIVDAVVNYIFFTLL